MARKRFSDEDVLRLLRQIELSLAAGSDATTARRSAGVTDDASKMVRAARCNPGSEITWAIS